MKLAEQLTVRTVAGFALMLVGMPATHVLATHVLATQWDVIIPS